MKFCSNLKAFLGLSFSLCMVISMSIKGSRHMENSGILES